MNLMRVLRDRASRSIHYGAHARPRHAENATRNVRGKHQAALRNTAARQHSHARALGYGLVGLLIALGLHTSSAASLGGLNVKPLGGASAVTNHITAVTLDWNLDVPGAAAINVTTLRVATQTPETFTQGDSVTVTADGGEAGTCTATTNLTETRTTADLTFDDCQLLIPELQHVALTVTGTLGTSQISGDIGGIAGALSAFDGDVVDPESVFAAGFESSPYNGQEVFENIYLHARNTQAADLVGLRAIAVLYDLDSDTGINLTYSGTIGTKQDNQGVWVETDTAPGNSAGSSEELPKLVIDIRQLSDSDQWPEVNTIKQYDIVVLRPQTLSANTSQYAVQSVTGTVQGGGASTPVSSGTEPVNLDSRLTTPNPTDR